MLKRSLLTAITSSGTNIGVEGGVATQMGASSSMANGVLSISSGSRSVKRIGGQWEDETTALRENSAAHH